ncbi:MAG: hypothetical protein ABI140_05060 [Jatrophihabitantaceae bacterium]
MSTDFEDPQLDALLARHAITWRAGFTPPPLDGMLAVATKQDAPHRRRWLLPVAAAVLLLVAPLLTVLATHRHSSVRPSEQLSTEPSPTGKLTVIGKVGWSNGVLQADGRTIKVEYTFTSSLLKCGLGMPVLRAQVSSQTSSSVTVTAVAYRSEQPLPDATDMCSPSSPHLGTYHDSSTVTLHAALGSRTVVDGWTTLQHPVFDARDIPVPAYVPAGFVDDGVSWAESDTKHQLAQRAFHNTVGQFTIERLIYDPNFITMALSVPAEPVRGHPAEYSKGPFGEVGWRDGKYFWVVTQITYGTSGKIQLDKATLYKIANSLP